MAGPYDYPWRSDRAVAQLREANVNTSRVGFLLAIFGAGIGLGACGGAQPTAAVAQCTGGNVGALEVCPGTNGRLLDPNQQNTEIGTLAVSDKGYEIMVLRQAPPLTTADQHPFPASGLTFASPASPAAPPRAIRSAGTRFTTGTLGAGATTKAFFQIVDQPAIGGPVVVGYIASERSATDGDFLVTFYVTPANILPSPASCLAPPAAGTTRKWLQVDPNVVQNVAGMRVSSPAVFSTR